MQGGRGVYLGCMGFCRVNTGVGLLRAFQGAMVRPWGHSGLRPRASTLSLEANSLASMSLNPKP